MHSSLYCFELGWINSKGSNKANRDTVQSQGSSKTGLCSKLPAKPLFCLLLLPSTDSSCWVSVFHPYPNACKSFCKNKFMVCQSNIIPRLWPQPCGSECWPKSSSDPLVNSFPSCLEWSCQQRGNHLNSFELERNSYHGDTT